MSTGIRFQLIAWEGELLHATGPNYLSDGMRTLESKSNQVAAIAVRLEPDHVRTCCYRVLERPREIVRYTIGQRQDAKNDAQK